jgi:hypothetical protein
LQLPLDDAFHPLDDAFLLKHVVLQALPALLFPLLFPLLFLTFAPWPGVLRSLKIFKSFFALWQKEKLGVDRVYTAQLK